ncbi:MAG: hydroxyacylglutathione hydrolase [Deltaproteobacteria bacterium]|nr:hydroxyacylglutathione hydrolase [Deltaproteobacteria bacterium]
MGTFLYTVVCECESAEVAERFEAWLLEGHAMHVVEAGALEAEVVRRDERVLENRYVFASARAFERYEREGAPRLRADALARFGTSVRYTRSTGTSRAQRSVKGLRVETVPYFNDNYAYLVHAYTPGARGTRSCVVVDPGDAKPVIEAIAEHDLSIRAIWCTHHHPDHVAGVPDLLAAIGEVPVLGSRYDLEHTRIAKQTRGLVEGEVLPLLGHDFRVMNVPGHTLGAIAYVGAGMAFTGDTLFLAGCGRVFEGTMPQMHASLMRFAELDPDTRLYVGHEYTEANLRFAAHIEPNDAAIAARLEHVRALRAEQRFTVPGTVREELATNPFLRAKDATEFAARREAKNTF